jgi:hypothetical protein
MSKAATDILCHDLPATVIMDNVHAMPECTSSFLFMTQQQKREFHKKLSVASLVNTQGNKHVPSGFHMWLNND